MNATTKLWTINDIKTAMRVRGSHWFDPDTMRFFKTRVLETVYQGEGGIYFVTSERGPHGPRKFTVRQFNPDTADISTVGDFNELSKHCAIRDAKQAAGIDRDEVSDEFKPVTELEQFRDDIAAHTGKRPSLETLRTLIRRAKLHQRMMVNDNDLEGEALRRNRKNILMVAKAIGCKGVQFQGDPRGCTVKLIFSDGFTNDFGKEGYCVPMNT